MQSLLMAVTLKRPYAETSVYELLCVCVCVCVREKYIYAV